MEVMAMELQIKKGKWFWSFVLAINMTKGGGGGCTLQEEGKSFSNL